MEGRLMRFSIWLLPVNSITMFVLDFKLRETPEALKQFKSSVTKIYGVHPSTSSIFRRPQKWPLSAVFYRYV